MTEPAPIHRPVIPQQHLPVENRRSLYSIGQAYRHEALSMMRVVVVVCAIVTVCTLTWTHGIYRASVGRPPLIVGHNEATGAVYELRPEALRMRLTDQMLRFFLLHWASDHFQRLAIGEGDYRRSLLFLSAHLTTSGSSVEQDLKQFDAVRRGESAEVSVQATNAVVTNVDDVLAHGCSDVSGQRCTALIQFEKTVGQEHTAGVVQVQFVMLSEVPERLVGVNPLGFVITAFHVSEAP